jgi:hypothetical protein
LWRMPCKTYGRWWRGRLRERLSKDRKLAALINRIEQKYHE